METIIKEIENLAEDIEVSPEPAEDIAMPHEETPTKPLAKDSEEHRQETLASTTIQSFATSSK